MHALRPLTLHSTSTVTATLALFSLTQHPAIGSTADCSATFTAPSKEDLPLASDPGLRVVFHLVGEAAFLPLALIDGQVTAVNDAFTGSATGLGFEFDAERNVIRYPMCVEFNDDFLRWASLTPNKSINVWVVPLDQALGEVSALPAELGKDLGTALDAVVLDLDALGPSGLSRNPGNRGHTLVHELGHYFGLLHPFEQGCVSATPPNCYVTGDLLCDTPPQSAPTPGGSCRPVQSCGFTTTPSNFMDLSDDRCRVAFTEEQIQRMRCTLRHYRGGLLL